MPRAKTSVAVVSPSELPVAIVDLRRMIDAAITEDDWIEIIRVAKEDAVKGGRISRDFLFKYRFGLPPQMVQHTGNIGMKVAIVEVQRPSETLPDDENEIIEGESVEIE